MGQNQIVPFTRENMTGLTDNQSYEYSNKESKTEGLSGILITLGSIYSVAINAVILYVLVIARFGSGSGGGFSIIGGFVLAGIIQMPSLLLLLYPFFHFKFFLSPVYYCVYAGWLISLILIVVF